MSIPIRRCCMLLLALPLLAVADPVTVTTHSTGIHRTNDNMIGSDSSMLSILGLVPLTSTAPLPYELTLTSTFDTDTMPSPESFWAQAYGDVLIDFRIGTQVYHYAGPANSVVHLAVQSANVEEYSHSIILDTPNDRYGFVQGMLGPSGSMGEFNPLAPLDVDESDLTNYSAYLYYSLIADPIDLNLGLSSSTMSVHVAAVPEPASFALLAVGLAMLTLPRLLSRRARRKPHTERFYRRPHVTSHLIPAAGAHPSPPASCRRSA